MRPPLNHGSLLLKLSTTFSALLLALTPCAQERCAQARTDSGSPTAELGPRLQTACDLFYDQHLAIDTYLSERYGVPASATDDLVTELASANVPASCVEYMIRAGRRQATPPPHPLGVIHQLSIDCDHVAYSSSYYLYVPPDYDADTPIPLVAIGHGGDNSMTQSEANGAALNYLQSYMAYANAPLGAILIAPATRHGWGPSGYSLVLSAISKTKSEFTIDPDAVYISGHSMGGHLAWRLGYMFPDRWGAVSPQSGGYPDWTTDGRLNNLLNLPGYSTWGETEPYGLVATNQAIATWLADHNFDWTTTQVPGDHPIDPASQPLIAQLFANNPRDLYPRSAHLHMWGPMKFDRLWSTTPPYQIYAGREYRWNTRHWLEIEPFGDDTTVVSAHAERVGNTVRILSNNVRRLAIYTHPSMFDLDSPIRIIVNGEVRFSGVVPVATGLMLETVREFDDRGRIFYGKIEVDVTTDAPVPDADPTVYCGNGTVDVGEDCDPGGSPNGNCDVDCTPATCGDGTVNPAAAEECDDGNTVNGDGCDATCRVEPCEVPMLRQVARLRARKTVVGGVDFTWDTVSAIEYHVNSVGEKDQIVAPWLVPAGYGTLSCVSSNPTTTCIEPPTSVDLRFYQVLAACGSAGDMEGPP